jgi:cytochrome c biogenesis protein CcmG, thiol:disulfide interchange protein DsbE
MTRQRQWVAVMATVASIGFALVLAARLLGREILEPNQPAPAFQALRLDGTVSGLADYRGKVLLLNVWATWCLPCRAEMPSMQRLQAQFADTDFRVVAVSVDQEGSAVVRQFAQDLGLTFDILHDPTGEIQRVYRTTGVPESWVIDRSGTITKKVVGATEWDSPTNVALVRALLDAR